MSEKRKRDVEKPPCKYGEKCYRRNPDHFQEYSHPSGTIWPTRVLVVGGGAAKHTTIDEDTSGLEFVPKIQNKKRQFEY